MLVFVFPFKSQIQYSTSARKKFLSSETLTKQRPEHPERCFFVDSELPLAVQFLLDVAQGIFVEFAELFELGDLLADTDLVDGLVAALGAALLLEAETHLADTLKHAALLDAARKSI